MEKAQVQSFLENCKAAGIEQWSLRFEGGNRSVVSGYDETKIVLRDNDLILIEPSRNYATETGQLNITSTSYEMIDNLRVLDVPFDKAIKLLDNLGIYDDEMKEFMRTIKIRTVVRPGTAGLAPITDADGNDVIPPGRSVYITE